MKLMSELRATQRYQFSPTMRESVQLLNLPLAECAEHVLTTMRNNPFLAEATEDVEPAEQVLPHSSAAVKVQLTSRYLRENNSNVLASEGQPYTRDERQPPSFKEALAADLATLPLSEPLAVCLAFAIEAIDERGRIPVEIRDVIPQLPYFNRYQEQWETAVRLIQVASGNGVGARSLKECLMLQLRTFSDSRERALALRLVQENCESWLAMTNDKLAQHMCCSEAELQEAKRLITSLNTAPGRQYDNEHTDVICPDVYIYLDDGCYCVVPNTELLPWLTVHPDVGRWKGEVRVVDAEVKRLMEEAEEFAQAVKHRHLTVVRVAAELIARQMAFFELGEQAIAPLLLREVADSLGLHESTVSRAVNQKYMHTPAGVIGFKRFFSRSVSTVNGQECSTVAVKALLTEILEEESRTKPFSDVELVERLNHEGVKIARRTVTKYRQQLNIPSFKERANWVGSY